MKVVLASLLCVLGLLGGVVYIEWQLRTAERAADAASTELAAARDTNRAQALAVATLQADRLSDAAQIAALAGKLEAISQSQQSKRRTFSKVVENATPAVKDVLGSKLPEPALQLFKRSAATTGADTGNKSVGP